MSAFHARNEDGAHHHEVGKVRQDWTRAEINELFALPFVELLFHAQSVHRIRFDPRRVQVATLLSIKTGGCPEDCAYCPQSARYDTGVTASKLMDVEAVAREARSAKKAGAHRFCLGAAWRSPKDHELDVVREMVRTLDVIGRLWQSRHTPRPILPPSGDRLAEHAREAGPNRSDPVACSG
jgi:biotin synthase